MLNVANIDVLLSCTIVLFCYAFIARERGKNTFTEHKYRINLRVNELLTAKTIIIRNWILLLLIPFMSMIISGYAQLSATINFIKYVHNENGSIFHFTLNITNSKDFILFLYKNVDSFFGRSFAFFSYYLLIGMFGNLFLLVYILKNTRMFRKIIIFEIAILQLIQVLYIVILIMMISDQLHNRLLIGIATFTELLVMCFSMAIIITIVLKVFINGFREKKHHFKKMLNNSINNNNKTFLLLLFLNVISFNYSKLYENYKDSMYHDLINSFNLLGIIINLIIPVLIIRIQIYGRSLRKEFVRTAVFMRINIRKLLSPMVFVILLNILSFIINHISLSADKSIEIVLFQVIKDVLGFSISLFVIMYLTYVVYFLSLFETKDKLCLGE